jgi:tetratricopeptide (TPR) repeat protein
MLDTEGEIGRDQAVTDYTAREVAKLLDIPVHQLRSMIGAKVLTPKRGTQGEYRFNFQDMVLLRTAKNLLAARLTPRKIRISLEKLRQQLPDGAPLTAVTLFAEAEGVVVWDGQKRWKPESGQVILDFESDGSSADPASHPTSQPRRGIAVLSSERQRASRERLQGSAQADYERGCALEESDPRAAIAAYLSAVERDRSHADAHINLGRLLQQTGEPTRAERHYQFALVARPDNALAWFNLGTALEDLGRLDAAIDAYRKAIQLDPSCADAYFNLAHLCEREGRRTEALRHFKSYRQLAPRR